LLAFASAIRIAESMKANAVRPLDNTLNTLLDEDRRQLLERAGPRRRLPVRTDASEVDVRKAVSGTSEIIHPSRPRPLGDQADRMVR
jgi:hypothetical protein